MRIAIVGCGAMGTVLGAYLSKNGQTVEMVDNYQAHVDAMNQRGAHIVGTVDMTVPVRAVTTSQMQGIYDVIFLLTKQTANQEVLPVLLSHMDVNSTICTLQNGVPEPSVAEYVGEKRTVGGTVLWGATFIEPGVSELTQDISAADHLFEIGEIGGTIGERIKNIAAILNGMGPAKITDSLMNSRWGKLVNNACMSGMSAASAKTFGEVLDHPKSLACLCYLGREVQQCCEAAGLTLPVLLGELSPEPLRLENAGKFEECKTMFLTMYEGLRPAKASMLQDLEKSKLTEVDLINGFVCAAGRASGIPTPFNDMVVNIVHGIERGELTLSQKNLDCFDEALFEYGL
ncbi:ketopantoate reductase family protein [Lacrimispora sp.]|uniref:ketopantoate reductase family protein n=1 Tax=Lacrimispora sp. TaxID=2719234 RepID=UPI0028974B28|nr:ketopantoate reductase family protein [Lacrimispora sp.]